MSHYPNYARATNAAYQLLAKNIAFSLATNVFAIVEVLLGDCKILTYSQACFLYGYRLEMLLEVSEFGFSIVSGEKRVILYNETVPLGSIRFTIAHEIGHAVLGHTDEHDPANEKEANCFARNLLCPIPIVYGLGIDTVNDYVDAFNVTERMAYVSYDKKGTDKYYITKENWEIISDMLDAYMMGFPDVKAYYHFVAS